MYNLLKIFALTVCLLVTTPIIATPINDAGELVQLLNNFQTMKANFEQFLINDDGAKIGQKTSGTMVLKRPGKFRWEIKQPNKTLIILNQDRSILYDADLEQMVKRKSSYGSNNPATLLSNSTESVTRSFKIVKLKTSGQGIWFQLTPKDPQIRENSYQWIKINFVNKKLRAMSIADNLGQKTTINFTHVLFNLRIPDKTFIFTPPPHTEIINQ